MSEKTQTEELFVGSLNTEVNNVPQVLDGVTDTRWTDRTIYNHYENPLEFMDAVMAYKDKKVSNNEGTQRNIQNLLSKAEEAYAEIDGLDLEYDTLYEDVARQVKDKLVGRGFTSAMLYNTVDFTPENTGAMSKQRAMMGRRDCYFKNPEMTDGKLFHDMYINLSYSWGVSDDVIKKNSYAIYALTKELARLIPIRVFVVNHVGTDTPTCYSYVLKRFGAPLSPKQFLFFTSSSKRTLGWATYDILHPKNGHNDSAVGQPTNSVSIADFNLDKEIDSIIEGIKKVQPEFFKEVA